MSRMTRYLTQQEKENLKQQYSTNTGENINIYIKEKVYIPQEKRKDVKCLKENAQALCNVNLSDYDCICLLETVNDDLNEAIDMLISGRYKPWKETKRSEKDSDNELKSKRRVRVRATHIVEKKKLKFGDEPIDIDVGPEIEPPEPKIEVEEQKVEDLKIEVDEEQKVTVQKVAKKDIQIQQIPIKTEEVNDICDIQVDEDLNDMQIQIDEAPKQESKKQHEIIKQKEVEIVVEQPIIVEPKKEKQTVQIMEPVVEKIQVEQPVLKQTIGIEVKAQQVESTAQNPMFMPANPMFMNMSMNGPVPMYQPQMQQPQMNQMQMQAYWQWQQQMQQWWMQQQWMYAQQMKK